MTRFERHPWKTLTCLLVIVFIAVDLVLGFFFCPRLAGDPNAFYHHELARNYRGTAEWGDRKYPLVTNSLGFKDAENRQVSRTPSGYRVLFLGDSFTEGVGVPFEQTFVGLFAAGIGKDIEVLNAAVTSYSPKLYYLKAKYLLKNINLKFNELIVFVDISDIQDEIFYEPFQPSTDFGVSGFYLVNKLDSVLRQHSFTYHTVRTLMRGQEKSLQAPMGRTILDLQRFFDNYTVERGQWTVDDEVFTAWGWRGAELAVHYMDLLYQLCRNENIAMRLAVYPWPNQILAADRESRQVKIWQQFAAARGIDFIDYFPIFMRGGDPMPILQQYFIPGDSHWNEAGHRLVAEVLLKRWKERRTTSGASR